MPIEVIDTEGGPIEVLTGPEAEAHSLAVARQCAALGGRVARAVVLEADIQAFEHWRDTEALYKAFEDYYYRQLLVIIEQVT